MTCSTASTGLRRVSFVPLDRAEEEGLLLTTNNTVLSWYVMYPRGPDTYLPFLLQPYRLTSGPSGLEDPEPVDPRLGISSATAGSFSAALKPSRSMLPRSVVTSASGEP